MPATQQQREFAVTTPLGDDVLLIRALRGREQLGQLFQYELDLLSLEGAIDFDGVVGDQMTIKVELPDGNFRYVNGFASRFAQVGYLGQFIQYQATIVPWLWFLTRTADCRIFQEMTVPDIIKQVFRDQGFTDFDDTLSGTYHEWEYCVQYRETDFNFVSRLMEQEGIYYYFKHEDGKHTLILSDDINSHESYPGYDDVTYRPMTLDYQGEYIYDWSVQRVVQPGSYTQNDFDFKSPRKDLITASTASRGHAAADYPIYDYPGEYYEPGDGDTYSRVRLEELQARHEVAEASSNARGISAGYLFDLTECPRDDQNRKYLITGTTIELFSNAYETDASDEGGPKYSCGLTAIEANQPFRAARVTPKPLVQGPQTAIVVGKSGEEIWTDQYGRVKVQFHWDRYGESNENSSCWIRVAQLWAGKQWGAMAIPRIGQEVIVDFLEGDPDRPIITGRVYNADSMPPYALPANMTQTGIKSRSSKGGTGDNFNEIRFEDKKGSEEVYIHAEKDKNVIVENDRTEDVGRDEKISIHRDRTEEVDRDEKITIHANRTEEVDKEEKITIHGGRTEEVDKDEKITIHGGRTEEVDKDEKITVHGGRTEEVDKDEKITIHGGRTEKVDKDESITIDGDRTVKIGKNDTLNVGKVFSVTAGDQISLTTGKASMVMKKDGTITITGQDITVTGKDITITGKGKIVEKASKDMILKGKKILQN